MTGEFEMPGEAVLAGCQMNAEYQVAVGMVTFDGSPFGVMVEACQHLDYVDQDGAVSIAQIVLSTADARRIGAAILNAADEADGTTPLCFYERPAGDA